ncbi:Kae1-associated serine/threonine protein kinase [archaeon]|nr:Kae1-associated serine/threonine protein kinase [archaeon]PJC45618.1 MAG: Kae1-associated kinase Bud32 [Candidatus Pacearchaeota archaeon CG_4_9_14_0_2_um_filter_30_8]
MTKKILSQGAEAIIYLDKGKIIKKRVSKEYRIKELDKKIIKRRTKAETKILKKASEIINSPFPEFSKNEDTILMPLIKGDKLSKELNNYSLNKQKAITKKIGKSIGLLHKEGIIHGDLTTSNIIFRNNEIYVIDFGLGSLNGKYEEKGVDIHLFKEALESKHFENSKKLFESFKSGYESIDKNESNKVFERLKAIEKRGRYRH